MFFNSRTDSLYLIFIFKNEMNVTDFILSIIDT